MKKILFFSFAVLVSLTACVEQSPGEQPLPDTNITLTNDQITVLRAMRGYLTVT